MICIKLFVVRGILLLICWLASLVAVVGSFVNLFRDPDASWRSLKAYDQLVNSAIPNTLRKIFGVKSGDPTFGHEDETVSSVLGKLYEEGRGNTFVHRVRNILEEIDPGHCDNSIERAVDFRAK